MNKDITTGDLLKSLYKTDNIEEYLSCSEVELPAFSEYIKDLCKCKGDTPQHVIKRSGIERSYGHQIFNGTRNPSRDKVIQLALGFGLNVEETQRMLRIANKSELYPKIKRDALLLYCITNEKEYAETEEALMLFDLQPLGLNAPKCGK